MNVWLLKDGENLPIQPDARKMRMWMLAERLLTRGHSIVWWASTFSHQLRKQLHHTDASIDISDRFRLRLIRADGYERNISWARYRHHCAVAKRFRELARNVEPPDAIVSALPTVELAYEAARYGTRHGVPSIIDVRDLWPDLIVTKSAPALRPFAQVAVSGMARKRGLALKRADSVVATSMNYLGWAETHRSSGAFAHDRVFFLGAETAPVTAASADRLGSLTSELTGKTVFAYIGSFGRSYELSLIIEAAARLASRGHSRIHFVLAGDGEQDHHLRRRAESLPNVTMTGWLDQDSLAALLRRADVGLIPCISAPGTVPNKVFDYLSAGVPVISSLEGEMAAIIVAEDIGFSYRCGDLEAFCRAVITHDTDPATRHRQAKHAAVLYKTRYRAEAIYSDYAEHIEAIVRERAR